MLTDGLLDAASVLDDQATGRPPDRVRVRACALALDTLYREEVVDRDILEAAAGLQMPAAGRAVNLDTALRAAAPLISPRRPARPPQASDVRTLRGIAARTSMLTVACSRCERRGRYRLDTSAAVPTLACESGSVHSATGSHHEKFFRRLRSVSYAWAPIMCSVRWTTRRK